MNLPKLAVSKPTTVLIIFVVLLALGIYCAFQLPVDLMPEMELPYVAVMTSYEGAGPQEVERSVTRLLESTLSSVTGLKTLYSISSTGNSLVYMELNFGTNIDSAGNEMRDRIDMVRGYLPADAGTPVILKLDPSMMPIMTCVVRGNRTPEELRDFAEAIIQPRLEQVDGIASVSISGGREKAVRVDIPRDRLEAYSLTITQIAQMIGSQNLESSGGTISEGDKNYSITTSGQYKSLDDIRNTVISYKTEQAAGSLMPQVRAIRLRDIADVYEGFKTESSLAYMNGESCVTLSLQKQSGKNSVQSADRAKKQIAEIKSLLPGDVEVVVTMDTTEMIRITINQILTSVIEGALFAVIVLFIFLRSLKSTIIIAITIPLAVLITLALMYFFGFTLNIMTLAGLSLGVGMLVDNSIVILENIYSYRERGAKATVAAILGSHEMLMAITASTLTTICVFLPLVMLQNQLGMIGQVFTGLTFTIVFSLLCSLAVAVVLVPVLASKYLKLENIAGRHRTGVLGGIDRAMKRFFDGMDTGYSKGVRWVLHHKALLLIVIILLFAGSLAMIPVVGFVFMPSQDSNSVSVSLEMPKGTTLSTTEGVIRQMESVAMSELRGVKTTTVTVGGGGMMGLGGSSTNTASLDISLYSFSEREPGWDSAESAQQKLRPYFNAFPGASLSFGSSGMMQLGGGSGGVDVIIKSDDLELARSMANAIVGVLTEKGSAYVTEPASSLEDGLPQVTIEVERDRMYNMGLNIYGVGNEIRANINGTTASRYQDAGSEIDIVVGLDEKDRTRLDDLEQIFVNSSAGQRVPLSNFARYRESTSPVSISRENQTRVIHVTGTPVKGVAIGTVQRNVEQIISQNIPQDENVNISYGGDNLELMEGLKTFATIILMAVILVFAVMASQFESFRDPFIVLFCIPLSVIGIIIVYLLMGATMNLITAVGVLVLVGIIVNNGIVLVDYTNLLRKRGLALEEACVQAAKNRLRPILMTTLTTVLALVPMAFFPGEGSEMTQPIGQTVLGGLSFGTLMTLFLMPTLYYILNRSAEKLLAKKTARLERRAVKEAQQ